jgi:hypothetical protein
LNKLSAIVLQIYDFHVGVYVYLLSSPIGQYIFKCCHVFVVQVNLKCRPHNVPVFSKFPVFSCNVKWLQNKSLLLYSMNMLLGVRTCHMDEIWLKSEIQKRPTQEAAWAWKLYIQVSIGYGIIWNENRSLEDLKWPSQLSFYTFQDHFVFWFKLCNT